MTRQISQRGLELIKRFEGFSAEPYRCPAGWWTIGYGHVLQEPIAPITRAQADELLERDVVHAERAVRRLIALPLHQNQYDALVSFIFNLGAGALQRSTLRRKINRRELEEVPAEWMKWSKAGGRILRGLLNRRAAEINLWLS